MQMVICGLSISSRWGNGHAVTFRALLRQLAKHGHQVLFLERDLPWYQQNRDLSAPSFCQLGLYADLPELFARWQRDLRQADLVMIGSYVPEGGQLCQWVLKHCQGITAFYDIDTPVTLAKLRRHDYQYLRAEQIRMFDLYLCFAGGNILDTLQRSYGAVRPRPLYCAVDPDLYQPLALTPKWDLGYLGTYSEDRQPTVEKLLLQPAQLLSCAICSRYPNPSVLRSARAPAPGFLEEHTGAHRGLELEKYIAEVSSANEHYEQSPQPKTA